MFIQNSPLEGPGILAELFARDGLDHTIIPAHAPIPQQADEPVVILGGPQGANDDSTRLVDQIKLIQWCHSRDIPVLGICLGAQLAAKALGGNVFRGHCPEVGFYDDIVVDTSHPLFCGAPDPYIVFHLHQDTFELPPGAMLLAGSPTYENQAFQHRSVVGLQFHLEFDGRTIHTLLHHISKHPLEGMCARTIHGPMSDLQRVRPGLDVLYSGYRRLFGL